MRPLAKGLMCALLLFGNLDCSVNILETFANKTTNQALLDDAQSRINGGDYNGAITDIGSMTGSFPSSTPVLELKAAAYAGLCGFQFLSFVTAMQGMGAQLLFPFLLKTFDSGSVANIANCVAAQNVMTSIGATAARSSDDNFFSVLVAFATIGNILSFYSDPTHAGAATAGFDPCAVGVAQTAGSPITDADARNIGASLSIAVANLTAVAGAINLGSGSLTAISGLCTTLSAPPFPAGVDFCAITDPAAFTANEILGIRSLVNESQVIGLGSNCIGSVAACACP